MTPPAEQAVERVFTEALEQDLMGYPGKWVAIWSDRVVAAGDSPVEALRGAARQGHKNGVLLHLVQEQGRAYFF